MSARIDDIQLPIKEEMQIFEQKFREFMKSGVFLLDRMSSYLVKAKGKQMRPMFVLLAAGACGGITEATYRGASLVELLHTATLIHDDVVDDAHYRRGLFSINALWKNKASVLLGDFLLARGLLLSIDNSDFELLRIVSQAVREMSEGELLQMEKSRKLDITEDVYFTIIRQKTATLIAACCGVGASSAGAKTETVQKLLRFGEKVGMAFQIKDDLFDYGTAEIGKPVGIDIKEKKMTLPLIYTLNTISSAERKKYLAKIKNHSERPEVIQEIIQFVKAKGGLEYAQEVMQRYYDEALVEIAELEDSVFKKSLIGLVDYTIERKK